MKLHVIGSGSTGNCYVLKSSKGKTLILEAGCSLNDVQKQVEIIPSQCEGVLLTHEHGDHAGYWKDFVKAGLEIYTATATAEELGIEDDNYYPIGDIVKIVGEFDVVSFKVIHDAVCPLGFAIEHKEIGLMLFITDLGDEEINCPEADHWLIEANYSHDVVQERINRGESNAVLAERIANNHMSIEGCVNSLKNSFANKRKTITLCHLSANHSDEKMFKRKVFDAVGKIPYIAKKGVVIEL